MNYDYRIKLKEKLISQLAITKVLFERKQITEEDFNSTVDKISKNPNYSEYVEKASDVAGSLQEKGAEGVEKLKNAASEANEKGRDLSEKADDAWMKAAENADAGKEKIQESLDSWY